MLVVIRKLFHSQWYLSPGNVKYKKNLNIRHNYICKYVKQISDSDLNFDNLKKVKSKLYNLTDL